MGTAAAGAVLLGAAAGGTKLAGGATQQATPVSKAGPVPMASVPSNWDYTADVVVVGYGGGGAVCAMTAYDAGANVLILEKSPYVPNRVNVSGGKSYPMSGGGGNTCISGGGAWAVADAATLANGIYNLTWGSTPKDVLLAFAQADVNLPAWCKANNIPYTFGTPSGAMWWPNLNPALFSLSMPAGGGAGLFSALDAQVQSRGIPVLFGTPATCLIQNPQTKEIIGVQATEQGTDQVLNVKASRAVILCTGGFEFDETMKLNYLKSYPVHTWGWQYNTGDGIKMAEKVGAGMWHMNFVSMALNPWFPNDAGPSSWPAGNSAGTTNGFIYVDKHGQRFMNEKITTWVDNAASYTTDFDQTVPEYTRIPLFMIMDQTGIKSGPMASGMGVVQLPFALGGRLPWSSDNSVEIAKGYIQQGNTLADLANAINKQSPFVGINPGSSDNTGPPSSITVNIDPNVLTATVTAYNNACAAKVDAQFGRPASTLVPIQTPPYYSMALWPGGPNTQGGPIRNALGQVCTSEGSPIPRLYSNGELGSIWGQLYQGAGNITEFLCFGQISGKNAAAEKPWS